MEFVYIYKNCQKDRVCARAFFNLLVLVLVKQSDPFFSVPTTELLPNIFITELLPDELPFVFRINASEPEFIERLSSLC